MAYAPAAVRPALRALFALDERLGSIVGTTEQPMIGLMRLAWWREALERLDTQAPPAEPLLKALAEQMVPRGVSGAALSLIEDGWAALLDGEADAEAIARHGHERGGHLFAAAAALLGSEDPRLRTAGEGWALADLGHRYSSEQVRSAALAQARSRLDRLGKVHWPAAARPLAALAALARLDARSAEPRRQGSPGRLARMLALRLTGR